MDKAAFYVDTFKDGSVDKNAGELAIKLRDEKLQKAIYKRNSKRFEIDWSGMDGISLETHSKYFNGKTLCLSGWTYLFNISSIDFVTEFYKIMLRLIDRSAKKVERSELGMLKYELHCHLWILSEACSWFVGRSSEVDRVKQYITGLSTHCFVVYGAPGSGNNS